MSRASDLSVIHSSDLHVDDGYMARLYGGDGAHGVRLVVDTAKQAGADLLLLAGDIFEHNRLPEALLEETVARLEEASMPVVILPGNHDPLTEDSAYVRGPFASSASIHVLGLTDGECVLFEQFDLEVWGQPHRDYANMVPLGAPPPKRARRRIAMAHGHYEQVQVDDGRVRPSWLITDRHLEAARAEYFAFGHWNHFAKVGEPGVHAYYSGSPETARTVNRVVLSVDGKIEIGREPIRGELP